MRTWKVVILVLAVSCSQSARNPILDKANEVHLEAVALYDEAHQLYDHLKKNARERQDSLLLSTLDSIHDLMHGWESGLYEIPGYEHSHDDGHGHKHEHKTAPKMTDASMLDYQHNARQAISDIKAALEKLDSQR